MWVAGRISRLLSLCSHQQELLAREAAVAQQLQQAGEEASAALRQGIAWLQQTSALLTTVPQEQAGSQEEAAQCHQQAQLVVQAAAGSGATTGIHGGGGGSNAAGAPPAVAALMWQVASGVRTAIEHEAERLQRARTRVDAGTQSSDALQHHFLAFVRKLAGEVSLQPLQHKACVDAIVRIHLRAVAVIEAQEAVCERQRAAATTPLGSAVESFIGRCEPAAGPSRRGTLGSGMPGAAAMRRSASSSGEGGANSGAPTAKPPPPPSSLDTAPGGSDCSIYDSIMAHYGLSYANGEEDDTAAEAYSCSDTMWSLEVHGLVCLVVGGGRGVHGCVCVAGAMVRMG